MGDEGETESSLPPPARGRPPPPPSSASTPPASTPVADRDAGEWRVSSPAWAAALHTHQFGWRWWARVLWWVVALPLAVFCWAATLRPGWPRRLGQVSAVGIAALVFVAALTDDEPSEVDAVEATVGFTDASDDEPAPPTPTEVSVDEEKAEDEPSTSAVAEDPAPVSPQPTPPSTSEPASITAAAETATTRLAALMSIATDASAAPEAMSLLEDLRALIAEADPSRPDYDRDLFFERGDLDGDCIDTRHEVLQEEAVDFDMSVNGCSVTVGEWLDPFSGQAFTDPADLQLDHVVALADAWHSGAWGWSDAAREAFSNHHANLNVIHGPENQGKADKGPAGYSPTNRGQICAYAVQYATVKVAWALTISRADFDAIETAVLGCDSFAPATVAASPTTTVATTSRSADCHPAYSPCIPNQPGNAYNCGDLPSGVKPVTVLTIGVDPYRLDGDNDGIGCESG